MKLAAAITLHAEALFNGVKIIGFSKSEEELIRATMSRVPQELLKNVLSIQADRGMGAKHGRYVPGTKTIRMNPLLFDLRQRFGKGQGWIRHCELTMVHEIGHSVFEPLPDQRKQDWYDLSGWAKGRQEGNLPPYVEKRPGWEIGKTEKWTHKPGVGFTRKYAERNPDEDFADAFAFVVLGKGYQMSPAKRKFVEDLIQASVHTYVRVAIHSPNKAYAERGN